MGLSIRIKAVRKKVNLSLRKDDSVFWIAFACVMAAAVVWVSRFCYRIAFFNLNERDEDLYVIPPGSQYESVADIMLQHISDLEQLPFEQLCITARDGVHLAARYYHFKDNAPVQILFHGYRGNGVREYSCGNKMAAKLGYNTIVVDERAHGKSGGHTISFGIKERYDCVDWAKYALDRFGENTPVFLSGVSMGAATVLMASELELPSNVVAITADCPYSSPGAIIRKVCKDVKIPGSLAYPFVVLGALLYGHFRIWESSPVKAVQQTTIPILLIHGEDDRFVPCEMSREIFKACVGPKRLVTFPNAGHGLSYLTDTPKYQQTMKNFLQQYHAIS